MWNSGRILHGLNAVFLYFASLDVMKQFDHPHIIRLIGLCMDTPIYIIMELAPHGEVRHS